MTDVQWPDISSHNLYLPTTLPPQYQGVCIRSNDGTYDDPKFQHNLAIAKHGVDTGLWAFFGVYFVWHDNWRETVDNFIQNVGTPHRRMFAMQDEETWRGTSEAESGDKSVGMNASRDYLAAWLGRYMTPYAVAHNKHRLRVVSYFNAGDGAELHPHRPADLRIILANYTSNPPYPGKLGHQYSDRINVTGLGPVDMNSADGYTVPAFLAALGLDPDPVPPTPHPTPTPLPGPYDPALPWLLATRDHHDAFAALDGGRLAHYRDKKFVAYVYQPKK